MDVQIHLTDIQRYTVAMSFSAPVIKFCNQCGHTVEYKIPADDNQVRAICPNCAHIQYQNPLIVVGTLPIWQKQILLCKRNIEPRKNFWTLPSGFMELEETIAQGAARETMEEAGAQFQLEKLYTIIDVVHAGQVHMIYLAKLLSEQFTPGIETIDARLFSPEDIPWEQIAFQSNIATLKLFIQDIQTNTLGHSIHHLAIEDKC